MRGSEFFRGKQLFPGYRSMGLSRNSARLEISNEQEQRNLSEYCMGDRAIDGIMKRLRSFTHVCLFYANQWVQIETEEIKENQERQDR